MNKELQGKGTVLIVDDDTMILNYIKTVLELEGYSCEISAGSRAALKLLSERSFDFMITDIVMPEIDGLELTAKAKNLRHEMPVIITTGFLENFSYDKAIEAGASDFIKKPFTEKELAARIKHVKLHEEVRKLALRDELTGLYNRRGFFTLVEHQFRISQRTRTGIYMLYADLDNLKKINDTLGHNEGDRALTDIAEILEKNYRASDIIARIGGDEFVVFPVGTTGDFIEMILGRLKTAVEKFDLENVRPYKLSISAGISFYDPDNPCSIDELLSTADKSMYERKLSKQ